MTPDEEYQLADQKCQLAYAEKQFEIYKMYALYNQTKAITASSETEREELLARMERYIRHMTECNEFMDGLRRSEL